ncbi:hypothetical protein [Beggiatoa leptomitoformis]|uniref:Uncharacterized protein n=1 Tax=Beggiatoa leptomitoformis TaxID=288004 RepID=A0A2N9YDJ9_9GAMM|nr:hypothetical protein [Beggiatoa leptomitoformis]ALG69022.1 hypothetical protein AL038_16675 [Beggiatoa leptomitoformis]AUI68578.1 hypothetical protein BLE401_07565 [Beggiatoa leptomitoformis]
MSDVTLLNNRLATLEKTQLCLLINQLVEKYPLLQSVIIKQLDTWQGEQVQESPQLPAHIDVRAVQQLASHGGDLSALLATIPHYLDTQQGQTALAVLEAVTLGTLDIAITTFHKISQDKANHTDFIAQANYIRLLSAVSELWADSFLKTTLSAKSRQAWQNKLTGWQTQLVHYMVYVFDTAIDALRFGWDYPPLQQILQGETTTLLWQETELDMWDESTTEETNQPYDADALISRYLRILKEKGNYQSYLYLAQADGRDYERVMMLLQLNRVAEAIQHYREGLYNTTEIEQLRAAFAAVGETI